MSVNLKRGKSEGKGWGTHVTVDVDDLIKLDILVLGEHGSKSCQDERGNEGELSERHDHRTARIKSDEEARNRNRHAKR
jgi:hypothetical protein